MGITSASKQASDNRLDCSGITKVTLALSASPDIISNPTDIVLVLDRSGSMTGTPLAEMKAGAKAFIDIIEAATNETPGGQIGSGSRMGIVSFASTASTDTQLITSVAQLKASVDALTAGGAINHGDAFLKATQLFDPLSANARVIVLFTDGKTTAGPPPAPIAAAARADGVIIYCIGLIGSDGIDVAALNDWATDPDASHVAVTPDAGDLEELFKDLAANISKTGATNIVINEKLHEDFRITQILTPTKGSVVQTDERSLRWEIAQLGVTANEGAALEFFIRHVGQNGGEKPVNEAITYQDNEGNVVIFPDPRVTVDCDVVVYPEPCPTPVELAMENCRDAVEMDAGDVYLSSLGRIIRVDARVKNVCPGRRVALGVILTEVDDSGTEYQRGMKAVTIPAHDQSSCRDVLVKGITFVVPEDLDVSEGPEGAICNTRNFRVRLLANNIDTDYRCREVEVDLS